MAIIYPYLQFLFTRKSQLFEMLYYPAEVVYTLWAHLLDLQRSTHMRFLAFSGRPSAPQIKQ